MWRPGPSEYLRMTAQAAIANDSDRYSLSLLSKRVQHIPNANQQHSLRHRHRAARVLVPLELVLRQDLPVLRRDDPDVAVDVHTIDLAVGPGRAGAGDGAAAF